MKSLKELLYDLSVLNTEVNVTREKLRTQIGSNLTPNTAEWLVVEDTFQHLNALLDHFTYLCGQLNQSMNSVEESIEQAVSTVKQMGYLQ